MAIRKRESTNRAVADSAVEPRQRSPLPHVWTRARRVPFAITFLLFCLGTASITSAQGNTAVITGAEHVFIRRGPGTEFPPFANLSQGATVEIQEMRGEWARVQTVTGQSGYVRSTFLSLTGERSPAATPGRAVLSTATPAERQLPTASTSLTQPKTPAAEQHPAQQPPLVQGQPDATPAATPAGPVAAAELEKLRSDVAQLTATVEQLQQRLIVDAPKGSFPSAPAPTAEEGSRVMTSTAILLMAIGLCVGWLLGNAFGRRQERGRRPRVRL